MLKKLLITTALAGAVGLAASSANAADSALTIWNAANPGGAETGIGTGSAVISSSSLGGITITTSDVTRQTPPGMTESNITIDNTTGSTQVLDIIAGTNGFAGPTSAFNASATVLVSTGGASLTGSFFVDNSNTLNGENTGPIVGTDIGNFSSGPLTGPFSFSSNSPDVPFSAPGTYAMAEDLQLTLAAGATVGVQSISMDAASAVPEPRTWLMGMIGFGLMAAMGYRRKHARFAI